MIRLGILGGGQLAQMMTQAAISLGIETAIFERKPDSPASRLTHFHVDGDWQDEATLRRFAEMCDVVTLENEFVDASVLETLEIWGKPVYPSSRTLATIQDKLSQKTAIAEAGVPVPYFRGVDSPEDVIRAGDELGWPLVLKSRRDGYDGYGNATLERADDVSAAWQRLTQAKGALLVEAWVPFVRELAIMVLRGRDGMVRTYPLVETVQRDHICHFVRAPVEVSPETATAIQDIAQRAVAAVDGVGVFGLELFELPDGRILYNEMAPRPHNSGHYTIEACVTSQFENHIRAVLGWPLGSTRMVRPAAVMVNVLGSFAGDAPRDAACDALVIDGVHMHIYGKRDVRIGRKMGHVTVLGDNIDDAEDAAHTAAGLVKL